MMRRGVVLACGLLTHGLQLRAAVERRACPAREAAASSVLRQVRSASVAAEVRCEEEVGADATLVAANLEAVRGLEPAALWRRFAELSAIPRPSKHEGAAVAYIRSIAAAKGLSTASDGAGNIVVRVPGAGAGVGAPPVLIQGHVDMVTEKNSDGLNSAHDFFADGIRLSPRRREGRWLTAEGTTLGADNGIGLCAALALLEEEGDGGMRPPLELLFTIDEETGLTGAKQLDAAALGLEARVLLNLDTEEWGSVYVGCAGGGDTTVNWRATRSTVKGGTAVRFRVSGLLGGHSGIDIGAGRANAVLVASQCVAAVMLASLGNVDLAAINGGEKHNAIPREAEATLVVRDAAQVDAVVRACRAAAQQQRDAFADVERGFAFSVDADPARSDHAVIDDASAFVAMLTDLPVGALAHSEDIADLVELSNNVAAVSTHGDDQQGGDGILLRVLCSTRSSSGGADLEGVRDKIAHLAESIGATAHRDESYPGWKPNFASNVLDLTRDAFAELSGGRPAEVKAIHAGLECGLLIDKIDPALDAVSFGPTITGAHSPDEAIDVGTVPPFFDLLRAILADLATRRIEEPDN